MDKILMKYDLILFQFLMLSLMDICVPWCMKEWKFLDSGEWTRFQG